MTLLPVSTGDPHVPAHNAEREAINALETKMPNKLDRPLVPMEGDVLRYNGTAWSTYQSRFFEGTGAPNGVVAAPVGSEYVDRAPASGAVKWTKVSGTGNTGWMLTAGDTLFRNVSLMVDKRTTGVVHAAMLRRVGDFVDLYLDLSNPTSTTSPWTVLTLPDGFRPAFERYGALQDNSEAATQSSVVFADGRVQLFTLSTGNKRDRYQGQWSTLNPWPATLPGSVT